VDPLDNTRFKQQLSETEWSVAEILQHLCLVEERVIAELEKALAREPQPVGVLRRMIPTSIVGLRLIRVKAPRGVTPTNSPDKIEALENYETARSRLKQLCALQGREKLKQVSFNHPFWVSSLETLLCPSWVTTSSGTTNRSANCFQSFESNARLSQLEN
jgi:hypothetical protein